MVGTTVLQSVSPGAPMLGHWDEAARGVGGMTGGLSTLAALSAGAGVDDDAQETARRGVAGLRELAAELEALVADHDLYASSDGDPLVAPELRALLRNSYPDAQLVPLKGLGHFPSLYEPERYTEVLRRFLDA